MIEPGRIQTLTVRRITGSGAFLGAGDDPESVLLPGKYIPEGLAVGDPVEVFVHHDSEDRPVATTRTPKLVLGAVARLAVVDIAWAGAFLDWGLEKDLLLPRPEWRGLLRKGDTPLVALKLDRNGRLAATMRIDRHLSCDSPYRVDDEVEGTVYEVNRRMGAFVAVDERFHAMIPLAEMIPVPRPGERVKARVTRVREDGKLDLALRAKAHVQMDADAERILGLLDSSDGFLALHDGSSPEEIRSALQMGKAAFKRAVGRLFRNRRIMIEPDGIRRV